MDLTGLGSLFDFGSKVIDRVIPDPAQKLAAQQKLMELTVSKDLAVMANDAALTKAQTDINTEEAKSSSLFVSGWRPSVGWVCSAALLYQYLLRPIGTAAYIGYTGHAPAVTLPGIDDNLWQLLTGMLGLGAMRSWDKKNGTAR